GWRSLARRMARADVHAMGDDYAQDRDLARADRGIERRRGAYTGRNRKARRVVVGHARRSEAVDRRRERRQLVNWRRSKRYCGGVDSAGTTAVVAAGVAVGTGSG